MKKQDKVSQWIAFMPVALLLLLATGACTWKLLGQLQALAPAEDYSAVGTLVFHYKGGGTYVERKSLGRYAVKQRFLDESYFIAEENGIKYSWTTVGEPGTSNYYLRNGITFQRQVFTLPDGTYITLGKQETLAGVIANERGALLINLWIFAPPAAVCMAYLVWWVVINIRRKQQGKPTYGKIVAENLAICTPAEKYWLKQFFTALFAIIIILLLAIILLTS